VKEPPFELEPLMDAQDVRRVLRCSLPLVYKWADQGRLPAVRIPCPGVGKERQRTMVRFKAKDVQRFIEEHYRAAR
jgi:hypothetical protein